MDKHCIFNNVETCSECGECYTCDLNQAKKCNNCGKCLQLEGYDIKSIEIDDILHNPEELMEIEKMSNLHDDANEISGVNEELWDYIDDIQELTDLAQDGSDINLYEEFPGLLVYKKSVKNAESEETGE